MNKLHAARNSNVINWDSGIKISLSEKLTNLIWIYLYHLRSETMKIMKLMSIMLLALVFRVQAQEPLGLYEMKQMLLNSNVDISVVYEEYVQAQQGSKAKVLDLLPTLSIDMLIYDYNYTILRSIIPEPHRFLQASSSKDMAKAADVNRTIVQKNLLEDLEKTFFMINMHQEMLVSLREEAAIKQEIARRAEESYNLGSMSFMEYYEHKKSALAAKSEVVGAKEILSAEKFSLMLILGLENYEEGISVEPAEFYNRLLDFPTEIDEAMEVAADSSKEVEQYGHLLAAAKKSKRAQGLSWLSWGGIGFDYTARVRIAKSNVRKIERQRTKAIYEVRNQVATLYTQIEKLQEKEELHNMLLEMAEDELERLRIDHEELLVDSLRVKRAELALLVAQRDGRRIQYDIELKYVQLKRAMGYYMAVE
jgi:hypothetical protein